jgi:hypothetical protein
MSRENCGWGIVAAALCMAAGVFGYTQAVPAQQGAGQPPFASAIDQRNEQIRAQQQTNELLREQIKLLREQLEVMRAGKGK